MVILYFLYFHCHIWPWGELSGVFSFGKISNGLESFIVFLTVESFSQIGLIFLYSRLMGSKNCFMKVIAGFFSPCHYIFIHLNAPEQQTDKISVFIEVVTCCWSINKVLLVGSTLIPMESTLCFSIHCFSILFKN